MKKNAGRGNVSRMPEPRQRAKKVLVFDSATGRHLQGIEEYSIHLLGDGVYLFEKSDYAYRTSVAARKCTCPVFVFKSHLKGEFAPCVHLHAAEAIERVSK